MKIEQIFKHTNFQPDVFGRSVIITSDNSVLFLYSFKPGQSMTDHTHPFSNEYLTVVQGEAQISVGVETVIAGLNSVVFVPRESLHSILNTTNQPLLVTSFMTPKP